MSAERKRGAAGAELGDKRRTNMGHTNNNKKKSKLRNSTARAPNYDPPESDLRRSLRRRNVKYVFDLDDYFDEDDLFEEDQRRREKKLNYLLNLQTGERRSTKTTTIAPDLSQSSSDGPSLKKRKVIDEIDEDDDPNHDANYSEGKGREITKKKPVRGGEDSCPATPSDALQGQPLPDKKTLELILDKLQKKDIYGVYAEPVDPEELPDYHDVIKHPMDFATVRKKLANGSYETLEQFEGDVFLICTNAMEYNAPDTIYHKQARSIKELATRKFEKLSLKVEGADKSVKPEQTLRTTPVVNKLVHASIIRTQEPFGSNMSSSAMHMGADLRNVSNASQNPECERHGNADVHPAGSYSFNENSLDKGDESLPGKGLMPRFGKKSPMQDVSRRETYDISLACNAACSWSMFSSSDGEGKQLIPVGLYSDHSYARSLARFAATLGSVVWNISSKRIEQALPQGFEFGPGWVGEYEPLPTPVPVMENANTREPPFFAKAKPAPEPKKHDDNPVLVSLQGNLDLASLPFFHRSGDTSCSTSGFSGSVPSTRVNPSDMSSLFLSSEIKAGGGSASMGHQHIVSQFRASTLTDQRVSKQLRQGLPPTFNPNAAESMVPRQNRGSTERESPKELASRQGAFSMAENLKQPDYGTAVGALPNGKVFGRLDIENISGSSISKATSAGCYQQGTGQVLDDATRMLAEKGQRPWSANSSLSSAPLLRSIPASTAAASGAPIPMRTVGFRPPLANINTPLSSPRNMQPQYPGELASVRGKALQLERNNSPLHAFVPQGPVVNGAHFRNQAMNYPQLGGDLSRFQLQPTWRSISPQMHPKQKQESLPPDLNIGFQPSGSPGGPSGVLVDPQQPDLALQL